MRGMRKLVSIIFATLLVTTNVYAADMSDSVETESGTVVIVTDITPQTDDTAVNLPEVLPLDVQMKTEDGVKLLVKTFEVSPDADPQRLIESGLTRNGTEYTLREILRQTLPGSAEQQTASQVVTVSSESDKREDILPLLPESVDYAENGFTGRLVLDANSLSTEVASTNGYAYTIKDSREFFGLERNDPYYIPKTTTKNGMTLALADIQWNPANSENLAAPIYSATAYYTGKGYGSAPDSYLVTAQYSGMVQKAVPGNVLYSIVYEAVPIPIIPESFDWGKAGMISLLVVTGCGFVVLAVVLLRKFGLPKQRRKVVATGFADYQSELEARPERRKPHALGYMRRDGGMTDE
ncbi:hypothetical protein LJC63_00555 [Ruminococcaceae bacterium OttesenSCG-928-L11]|nr:hypothetical protein [Ruminococcaceae bacterium OttesenSCG-928-L11]